MIRELLASVRLLLLPPEEDGDPITAAGFDRMKRVGLVIVGAIAALAPLIGLAGSVVRWWLQQGLVEPRLHAATVETNLVIAGLGVLLIAASRTSFGRRRARTLVGAVAVAAACLIQSVYLLQGQSWSPELPYLMLVAVGALPFRPAQAAVLGLAAGASTVVTAAVVPALAGLPPGDLADPLNLLGHLALLGALVLVMVVIAAALYRGRTRVLADLREREALREQLSVSERKYRTFFEQLSDAAILVDDRTGRITMFNQRLLELLGVSSQEASRMHFSDFLHPDEVARVSAIHRARVGGEDAPARYRLQVLRSDGRTLICELAAHRSPDHRGTIAAIRDVTDQVRLEREIAAHAEELERKNAALHATRSQLVQSEKMASLGNLVAGIAHEINTPVGAVNASADTARLALDVIRKEAEEGELGPVVARSRKLSRALQVLAEASEVTNLAARRIVSIVRSLRSFARLDEATIQQADLHAGIETTLTLLHHELKHRIEIRRELGDLPPVTCSPDQLNQVFMNLLQNAVQAIEETGTITIRTRRDGDQVVLEFADTGKGIPAENLERIFDPGFTTKGVGVGTGLGLAISYRIVTDHGGTISVASEPGRGSTFTVRLPIVAASVRAA